MKNNGYQKYSKLDKVCFERNKGKGGCGLSFLIWSDIIQIYRINRTTHQLVSGRGRML